MTTNRQNSDRAVLKWVTDPPKPTQTPHALRLEGHPLACSNTPRGNRQTSYALIRILSMVLLLLSSVRKVSLRGGRQRQEDCS
jgi:hypothetical protein